MAGRKTQHGAHRRTMARIVSVAHGFSALPCHAPPGPCTWLPAADMAFTLLRRCLERLNRAAVYSWAICVGVECG